LTSLCLAGAIAPCLMATAATIANADERFAVKTIISLPDGNPLRAFDISWVDPTSHTYALASSATAPPPATGPATNPRIILVDTQFNVVTKEYNASPTFAGNCSIPPNRDTMSGPNGTFIVEKGRNADIWAGDGPIFSPSCMPNATNSNVVRHSSVRVLDLNTGATRATIDTGGVRRTDEGCYNPVSDVVLIANDDPLDNFITFIGEDSYQIIQKIHFDGTDSNANHLLANGIEQCAFNPRDGKFYINLPNTGASTLATPLPGVTLRISGHAPFHVEAVFPLDPTCGGASGLTIGPDHQIGLACGGANAEIIDDRTGGKIALLTGLGGADETWYNPGDNHYFFGISAAPNGPALGVADAGPPPSVDPSAPSATGAHSVAADPISKQVYVPISANAHLSTLCSTHTDVFGNAGSDTLGCIAVYTAPSDGDDCVAEGMPVIAVNEEGDQQFHKHRCHD
jgi:hypothetical protein